MGRATMGPFRAARDKSEGYSAVDMEFKGIIYRPTSPSFQRMTGMGSHRLPPDASSGLLDENHYPGGNRDLIEGTRPYPE
jgi:hypothetical protein